jgi:glycosyltransferase involved in cell wall biosynthesis
MPVSQFSLGPTPPIPTRQPRLSRRVKTPPDAPPDVLYLGFTFPPGVAALHPAVQSFGHAHHARMVHELERTLRVESVNLLPFAAESPPGADPASGLVGRLTLVEKKPEVLHRRLAAHQLRRFYLESYGRGRGPKAVFVYNLTPVFNHFIRWLRRQPNRPRLILHLEDSPHLGRPLSGFKRFRYRFKPLYYPDDEMIGCFDGCVGLSQTAEAHFQKRGIPYFWLPGASDPGEIDPAAWDTAVTQPDRPIHFGYFGSLSPYAGALTLAQSFLESRSTGVLEMCGYGKQTEELEALARKDPRLRFRGLLNTPTDCLRFGAECDVLVNPRPASHGNENNFPSKVFQYASCARAILTTRLGGVDTVFGSSAHYLPTDRLTENLKAELERLALVPRTELRQRGAALRQRVVDEYTYERWGEKTAAFIRSLC